MRDMVNRKAITAQRLLQTFRQGNVIFNQEYLHLYCYQLFQENH